ncbi:MAG: class I SAM-dependent methyltransferase [Pseudomonadota bacterium]
MDLAAVKARVAELDEDPGWYQNIELGNGVQTKTRRIWREPADHPADRWRAVEPGFPKSFADKSVLDVGCNAGFFSFKAAERGATDIVAVDYNERYIEQAKFANEVRGDKIDFRVGSVENLRSLKKRFDIVLCIGLLYHVKDLLGGVREIAHVTSEMAIIESAIYNDADELPLIRVAGGDTALPGTWHPNIAGLTALCLKTGFKRVEPLFKEGGRGGVIAYK